MLLVANAADSTLAIVDAATLRLVGHVSTGEEPHEVVTSPDGRFAFVSNYGTSTRPGSTLSVIDVIARKEVRRVDLGALLRPHGLYRSDGKIYFTAGGSRAVARYDPDQGRVDWMMGTGQDVSHLLVVTDNGRKIYTSNMGSNTVTVLTFHDGLPPRLPAEQGSPAIKQMSTGGGPEALDLSPDGRELWVANHHDGTISIIDTADDRVRESVGKVAAFPIRLKFTPDGRRVLICDMKQGELVVLDAARREVIRRVAVGGAALGLAVAPDGERAFVSDALNNRVFAVDLQTLSVVGSVATGRQPDGLTVVSVRQ
jgi:YVTN family beta-propeller protein